MRRTRGAALLCVVLCLLLVGSTQAARGAAPNLSLVQLGTVPMGVAVDSSTGSVFALLYINDTTAVLDSHNFTIKATIDTPGPTAVAVDPSRSRVYIAQASGFSISVIDASNDSIVAGINGTSTCFALAVDAPDNLLLCASSPIGALFAVDESSGNITADIPVRGASSLAVDPAAHEAFVGNISSNYQSGSIEVVNTTTLTIVRSVPIPMPPSFLAVDPTNNLLFVSSENPANGTDFVALNDRTFQMQYSEHLGESPDVMAVGPSSCLYVGDPGTSRLYEIDDTTGQVLLNSTGNGNGISFAGITAMAYDNQTGNLFLTEYNFPSLIVLSPPPTTSSSSSTSSTSSTMSSSSSTSSTTSSPSSVSSSSSSSSTKASSSSITQSYLLVAGASVAVIALGLVTVGLPRRPNRRGLPPS